MQLEFSIYRDQENCENNNFVRADLPLFKKILEGTIRNQNLIDQLIVDLLKDGRWCNDWKEDCLKR